ncbi:AAA family ATPase [Dyadobacter psychrotolerans]|uniref:AAA family ATPase n=1 Tax=Dyadobacter psychrotolerans TaxID=2541721 RepID=A0A4R5DRF6_9BACT|nr:AAA family ATPase [Dyadobacter psychrotolerans]TDE13645.1 AAA family ATPase [Dyadobacter psychrotolerans]
MDDNSINSLKEALRFSPDNIPLKQHLAEILLRANRLEEAEEEFSGLLKLSSDSNAKFGLARVFFLRNEYSKCNVILEHLIEDEPRNFDMLLLYSRALLRENTISSAMEIYKRALKLNPGYLDEELDRELRLSGTASDDEDEYDDEEYDDNFESSFIQRPSINFSDVGGMENVKKEIDLKIIKPLLHPDLYKAYGKKTGGGILLYGPPGCGKTYIAKATAGQVNAKFINVGLSDILDMWIGSSEKNLHDIFEVARQNTPCVLFFDEIDALGASRSDMKQSSGRHLINQFLQELDGIDNNNEGILILGATNTPWHLDPAFRRPGRFDRIIFVPPPDEAARESILQLKLRNKPVDGIDLKGLAKKLEHYSGADIEALIDIAIEEKIESSFTDGIPKPIKTVDLMNASRKHKSSTLEWFTTAKNFALFANDSGLYDDILLHLKIKK